MYKANLETFPCPKTFVMLFLAIMPSSSSLQWTLYLLVFLLSWQIIPVLMVYFPGLCFSAVQIQSFLFIISHHFVQLCFQELLNSIINGVCGIFVLAQLLYGQNLGGISHRYMELCIQNIRLEHFRIKDKFYFLSPPNPLRWLSLVHTGMRL